MTGFLDSIRRALRVLQCSLFGHQGPIERRTILAEEKYGPRQLTYCGHCEQVTNDGQVPPLHPNCRCQAPRLEDVRASADAPSGAQILVETDPMTGTAWRDLAEHVLRTGTGQCPSCTFTDKLARFQPSDQTPTTGGSS